MNKNKWKKNKIKKRKIGHDFQVWAAQKESVGCSKNINKIMLGNNNSNCINV